jgi:hypothetical protein
MENQIPSNASDVREISLPIFQCKGWMRFLAVLSILDGAVCVFTVVGIVIAWLPIWVGVLLWQSSSRIERAEQAGDKASLVASLGKLKTYFVIQGVITLLGIIFVVLVLSLGAMAAILGALKGW